MVASPMVLLGRFRRPTFERPPLPDLLQLYGVRSAEQLGHDARFVWGRWHRGQGFQFGPSTVGFARPDLSLPAYVGLVPQDGLAPILHLFDRTTGGQRYSQRVTRRTARDFRGGTLSYDDHDGTDFVCPIGTPLCAAAPGVVVAIRDRWLRGGLTVCVDHGQGVVTQYTHCTRALRPPGEPVARGEPVALSGVSGIDLAISVPWVAPHLHFSVWVSGQVVDPFRAPADPPRAGHWLGGGMPRPSRHAPDDAAADGTGPSPVDDAAVERLVAHCLDAQIRQELARAAGYRPGLAAILEDALHHERHAFPPELLGTCVRPAELAHGRAALAVALTLPLPESDYRGARFGDAPWTQPRS